MTAVMVEIRPRTTEADQPQEAKAGLPTSIPDSDLIEIIAEMDEFSEVMMCSCSASDDNPY
jgi:CDGSH-type Zn-finger protein